jgi:uncharacterized protein
VQLYCGTTAQFIEDTVQNRTAAKLQESFFAHYRHKPSPAEVNSWRNSLRAMCNVIQHARFDDNGLLLEYQLPLSSKRLDFMITGRDRLGAANAVIVELKQWSEATASPIEGCVATFVGRRMRDELHPSVQVGQYQQYLADCQTAFSSGDVALAACSYLHNFQYDGASEFFHPRHRRAIERYPLFTGDQTNELAAFMGERIRQGDGTEVLQRVLESKFRASKRLLDHTAAMIDCQQAYVLLDEQLVVFNAVLAEARKGFQERQKVVILVKGGPGTGKSVIALNLVGQLCKLGFNAVHATGSKAFTENIKKVVGKRAGSLFRYYLHLAHASRDEVDVLILDEAHRIRATSNTRFSRQKSEKPQVEELVHVSKVSVFFIDDLQVVRPGEVGSSDLIRGEATRQGARLHEFELEAQFRCAGSDAFVNWVDNTLDVRRTASILWETSDAFDFQIIDSVEELEAKIRGKVGEGQSARLTAGYCWPWSDPRDDGALVPDVVIGAWRMPWNAKPDAGRLAAGIPKSHYWATDPRGIDQVGCVYTAQGFEFDYVGIIIGKDLRYDPRSGTWFGDPAESRDGVVSRAKKSFIEHVKNTYRVLLTRGIKGCYVHFLDKDTEVFVRSRMESRSTPQTQPAARISSEAAPVATRSEGVRPFRVHSMAEACPYENCVPILDLKVAAGQFGESQLGGEARDGADIDHDEWAELPTEFRPAIGMFVAQVLGESMNRRIPNGAWCLFRRASAGSRSGRVAIAQHRDIADPDTGGHYTVKLYESRKRRTAEGSWRHEAIVLRPDTTVPGYEPIALGADRADEVRIVAELVAVLG